MERVCRLEPAALDASLGWIVACRTLWNARLDELESLIAQLQAEEQTPAD